MSKDKGKLGALVQSIEKSNLYSGTIYRCYGRLLRCPRAPLYCNPLESRRKIQCGIQPKTKEVGQEFIGSGELASLKPGMKIRGYFLSTRDNFRKKLQRQTRLRKSMRRPSSPTST